MRRQIVVVLGFAFAAVSLPAGAPQTPQQRPVFRAGSVFVNVDAYPRRDGKVIDGLTQADFEILEDGKPQAIEKFEFVRIEPNTPEAERRDPTSIADAERQAADPYNRVFIIYLDIFHTGVFGSHYTREPVLTFLNRTLSPNDLFAVTTPEQPPSHLTFGRRTETLEAELTKYWNWGEAGWSSTFARNPYEAKMLMCPGGEGLVAAAREDQSATNLEGLMTRLGNLRDERKNIIFISEGWAPRPAARPGTGGGRGPHIPTIGVGPTGRIGMGTTMSSSTDMAWCDAQAARFANIDFERRFKDLLTMAQRANVAFYTVDVGGLRTHSIPASEAGGLAAAEAYRAASIARLDTLKVLAINTDGESVTDTNDLASGVRRISDDLSAYYLLGYYSTNGAADGRYRRIEVKVKQPGVKVSARRGYQAPTEEMRKAEAAAAARPPKETTAVDTELTRLSRLRTDARMYTSAIPSGSSIDLVVELASQESGSGRWPNGANVTVSATPKQEGAAAVTGEGRIEPGARSVVIKLPITSASAAGWRARVRVTGGDQSIEDELDVLPSAPTLIGDAIVFRTGSGARSPLRPVADFKFYRTERVHIEWATIKPLENRTARLLNRSGAPVAVPVTLTERQDGDRLMLAADLSLAPLADGDYVVELTATTGEEKIVRLVAFRVIR